MGKVRDSSQGGEDGGLLNAFVIGSNEILQTRIAIYVYLNNSNRDRIFAVIIMFA